MSSSAESGNEKCFRGSKRIPSPSGNVKSLLKPEASPAKDSENVKCSSPSTSSGSSDDSVSSTPTPSASVVTNGLPPVSNDLKNTDVSKPSKSGGRLKFFKDGVLCLELSHHDEGEKTKWVQIKTKTVIPAIVHTTKEATIPCHLATSAFSSSSAAQSNLRVESSTSHSMSDDGSSMLSSPRDRESTWKQPVPLKGVSTCHEFFMKPAKCALNYRKSLQANPLITFRRPYCRLPHIVKIEFTCSCAEFSVKKLTENGNLNETNDETDLDTSNLSSTKTGTRKVKSECSLDKLIKKLCTTAESRCKVVKLSESTCESKSSPTKTNLITPKKRVFKDVETRDSNFRPKKKSPAGCLEKTILTIPGLNSEFYKRHISTVTNDLSSSAYADRSDRSVEGGCKAVNLTKASCKNKSRLHSPISLNSSGTSGKNLRSPHLGAKSVSTSKHLLNTSELLNNPLILNPNLKAKSAISFSNYAGRGNSSPKSKSRTNAQELLKEEQLFQQQTMSKAISYTINSLLGTSSTVDNACDSSKTNNLYNGKFNPGSKKNNTKGQPPPLNSKTNHKLVNNDRNPSKNSGSFSPVENDQNSFLRHLLDTSDPIPSCKTERSAIISNKSLKNSNSTSNHSGSRNVNSSSSTANKSATVTKSSSKPVSNSSSRSSSPPHHSVRHSFHPTNTDVSPYSNLFRPADSTAAFAAAAAAFQHYGSLLPAAFLPHFSASPAAAAAAVAAVSYLVPNPAGITPSTSAVPQLYGNSNVLNLSQNIWPGFLPGSAIHPSFGGTMQDEFTSLSAFHRRNSNSPYFDANPSDHEDKTASSSSVDNDAPLNLCKKTRPS